jgi:hypothetical protein
MMSNQQVNTEGLIRGVTYDPEETEKTYLILIDGEEVDNEGKRFRDWEIITGRQAAYDWIKNMLENNYVMIDVDKSKIIVSSEKVKVTDGISIYDFMKAMKQQDKVIDYTSFDIDDYVGDVEGAE